MWSGDMVDRELSTKFGLDPCNGFRETSVYGQTVTDTCATTVALLTKLSTAKHIQTNLVADVGEHCVAGLGVILFPSGSVSCSKGQLPRSVYHMISGQIVIPEHGHTTRDLALLGPRQTLQ